MSDSLFEQQQEHILETRRHVIPAPRKSKVPHICSVLLKHKCICILSVPCEEDVHAVPCLRREHEVNDGVEEGGCVDGPLHHRLVALTLQTYKKQGENVIKVLDPFLQLFELKDC